MIFVAILVKYDTIKLKPHQEDELLISSDFYEWIWSYPVIAAEPAVHLTFRRWFCFSNDKLGSGPYRAIIHRIQLRTTWWHQCGRGILKMKPALVWRQCSVSINAETESCLLIILVLAFTGHLLLTEAEINYHHCAQRWLGTSRTWILLRWVWRTSEQILMRRKYIFDFSGFASSYCRSHLCSTI